MKTDAQKREREAIRRRRKRELRELNLTWLPAVRHDWLEEQRCFWGYLFGWLWLMIKWAREDLRRRR